MPRPEHAHKPDAQASPWVRRLVAAALLVGIFGVYASTAARTDMNIDAHAAAVESWQIASTGSPWLEGNLTDQMASNRFIGEAANGHTVGLRMAGPVLAGVPFYWVLDRDADPAQFSYFPSGIAAAFLAAVTAMMVFLTVSQVLSQRLSLGVTFAFALASPTWTISADQLWTHSVTQLGIAGAALASSRQRWGWAGLWLGIAMLGRPHVAIVAAALGIGIALSRRTLWPVVRIAVPTTLTLAALAVWNRWMFGRWSIGGSYGEKTHAALSGFDAHAEASGRVVSDFDVLPVALSNYLGFLVSFDRGLLVWSPALLLMAPALARSWRSLPDWSRWLLIGGVAYTVVQLRLNAFPGGDAFWGYRYGLELLTCSAPALAFSLPQLGKVARSLLPTILTLQFAALAIGAVSQGYYIEVGDVWSDNSFWMALRHQPGVVGTWLALCVGIAVVGTVVAYRRSGSKGQPTTGYGQHTSVD